MADNLDIGNVVMGIVMDGLGKFSKDATSAGVAAKSVGEIVVQTTAQFETWKNVVGEAAKAITGYTLAMGGIRQVASGASALLSGIGVAFKAVGAYAMDTVRSVVPGIDSIRSVLSGLYSTVSGTLGTAFSTIGTFVETAIAPLRSIASWLGDIVGALGTMAAGAAKAFIGFGLVAANAAQQLVAFALDVQEIVDDTADLASVLGTTAGEVNLLKMAFAGVGIEAQQMASVITRLTTKAMDEFTKSGENAVKALDRQASAQDAVTKAQVSYRRSVEDAREALAKAQEGYNLHAKTLDAQRSLKAAEANYVKTVQRAYEDYQGALGGANEKMRIAGIEAEKLQGPLGRLGVKLVDQNGELKTAVPLFFETARAIAAIPNPTEQSAKAIEIFGRSASRILPILKEGPEAIEKYRSEIQKLGINFSKLDEEAAAKVESGMYRIRMAFDGVKVSIGAPLLNPLALVLSKLTAFVANTLDAARSSGMLASATASLQAPFYWVASALEAANIAIGTVSLGLGIGDDSTDASGKPALSTVLTRTGGVATKLATVLDDSMGKSFVRVGKNVTNLDKIIDDHNSKLASAEIDTQPFRTAYGKARDIVQDISHAFKKANERGDGFVTTLGNLLKKWSASEGMFGKIAGLVKGFAESAVGLGPSMTAAADGVSHLFDVLKSQGPEIIQVLSNIVESTISAIAWLNKAIKAIADYAMARKGTPGQTMVPQLDLAFPTQLSQQGARVNDVTSAVPNIMANLAGQIGGLPVRVPGGSFVSSVGRGTPSSMSVGPQMSFAGNLNVYGGGGGGGLDPLEVASAMRSARAMGAI